MSELRLQRRAETRDRIIRVVLDLLAELDPAAVSMPAVAEASGISLRTVYRYFPTKTELLHAAGAWFDEHGWSVAVGRERPADLGLEDFRAYQRVRFADFDTNRAGILAQLGTPGGRELRRQRLDEQRGEARTAVSALIPELPEADLTRLCDAIIATSSSASYAELVDRMGLGAADAADLTAWMVEAFAAYAARTGTTRPLGSIDRDTSVFDEGAQP